MAVTATDEHDRLFNGANQGNYIAVAAPGVDILVPAPNGAVSSRPARRWRAPKSAASRRCCSPKIRRDAGGHPHHSGVDRRHLGAEGMNPQFGAGLVDPLKALRFVPTGAGSKPAAQAAPLQPH